MWMVTGAFEVPVLNDGPGWRRSTAEEQTQLELLHEEIYDCCELVGATILEAAANSGLILCKQLDSVEMTAEDVAVRLGQLLCRWAQGQEPLIKIKVGVHTGRLTYFELPSCARVTYLGEACTVARHLARVADQSSYVHLSAEVKKNLAVLSRVRMRLGTSSKSYYMSAATEVVTEEGMVVEEPGTSSETCQQQGNEVLPNESMTETVSRVSTTVSQHLGSHRYLKRRRTLTELVKEDFRRQSESPDAETCVPSGTGSSAGSPADYRGEEQAPPLREASRLPTVTSLGNMSFEAFRDFLEQNGVNVSRFGRGDYKSLDKFYNEAVIEQECSLVVGDGALERVKELVRISLVTRGPDSRQRELRIGAQTRSDGQLRLRDQKLAMSIKFHNGETWQDAVEACFEEKFGLSPQIQRLCFVVDWESATSREERSMSMTVPDIVSIYKTRDVTVTIKDKERPELTAIGLPDLKDFVTTKRGAESFWTWAVVGNNKEDELLTQLQRSGVDPSDFLPGAFAELHDEVYITGQAQLETQEDGTLVRKIRVIKVWLHAEILAVDHVLQLKSKYQRGKRVEQEGGRPIAMRINKDIPWRDAVEVALLERIGLQESSQMGSIAVDQLSHKSTDEIAISPSYPGLKSIYHIDEVSVHVVDVHDDRLGVIGLPDGHDFSFSRNGGKASEGGSTITHWAWIPVQEVKATIPKHHLRSITDNLPSTFKKIGGKVKRKLPVIEVNEEQSVKCLSMASGSALERFMARRKTDWTRAKNAARRIRDPNYTCKDFWEDVTAGFPELELYVAGDMSSGRSGDEEYQRTMGAMFCLFWLMRLHLDGSQAFCFGLDEDWKGRMRPPPMHVAEEWKRRKQFFEGTEWSDLELLVHNAGLLKGTALSPDSQYRTSAWLARVASLTEHPKHDEDRTLAMLVLTAIHDVMKNVLLLPTVAKKGGPFKGYKVGEVISDHDAALAYILERYPQLLPSFHGLPKHLQESIKFTHSKMDYNMGWLVQAEAPPGALLRKFREVVVQGGASSQDLSFYFLHWFTDLAGAEPYPQEGCEKFVLKFPLKVLNQFLESFAIVQHLSKKTNETQVLEEYLQWRWENHDPTLPPAPSGRGSIAKMRLIMMAQAQENSELIMRCFDRLKEADREVLSQELAITGCQGQYFQRDRAPAGGPAILVYYAPALMQKAGRADPGPTMAVLAEVLRQARAMWPLCQEMANETVTVRIDTLKELDIPTIVKHDQFTVWTLARTSGKDGAVEAVPITKLNEIDFSANRMLNLAACGSSE